MDALRAGPSVGGIAWGRWASHGPFPSSQPRSGIDWVLTTRNLRVDGCRVIASGLSDHLEVVADVSEGD